MTLVQSEQEHPIRVVARRTGLTPHVIRVWEKRYDAVTPQRTSTNRRLYSEADIERLRLLRRATEAGYSIGQVAQLPTEQLSDLITPDEVVAAKAAFGPVSRVDDSSAQSYLDACLEALQRLDADNLESQLRQAAVSLSQPVLIDQVVSPLMHTIGDQWREGSIRVAHEHLASAVVRSLLGSLHAAPQIPNSAPNIIVTTPAGQLHELGALIAAIIASAEGWRVTYLGPNLPAEEIAGAAQQNQAKAVALSIIYPGDDPRLGPELEKLRHYLPKETALLVGGRGADGYTSALNAIQAIRLPDMATFRTKLESIRTQPGSY